MTIKAWAAIKDLLGGEERIDSDSSSWGDSFIVNLGTPELEGNNDPLDPKKLTNWHVDGDFFVRRRLSFFRTTILKTLQTIDSFP